MILVQEHVESVRERVLRERERHRNSPHVAIVALPVALIERVWKFLRKKALNRWHKTFEAMQTAVAEVLDRLGDYRDELATLMTERFAIVEVEPAAV